MESLKKIVFETLRKLGWEAPPEDQPVDSSRTDNLRVDRPLGEGRFGPAGDLAKGV